MKTVWDAERDLDLTDITQRVNEAYNKKWRPQTVSTFLARLVKKGYLRHYRQGRVFGILEAGKCGCLSGGIGKIVTVG